MRAAASCPFPPLRSDHPNDIRADPADFRETDVADAIGKIIPGRTLQRTRSSTSADRRPARIRQKSAEADVFYVLFPTASLTLVNEATAKFA
jgi:hypothetical protein